MPEIDFVFNQEMAKLLKKFRIKSNLSQTEIAKRIGFVPKSGKIYISCLENGKIKNPSLGIIIMYLRTCEASSRFSSFLSDDALQCARLKLAKSEKRNIVKIIVKIISVYD